jgi:hypothetical protein
VGWYAEQALETHMVEALLASPLDDVEAQTWLLHSNALIATSAATAFGSAMLATVSAAKEGAGDLVGAARVAWASRNVRGIPATTVNDLSYRASDLLERADDASAIDFERAVLKVLWSTDMMSERNIKAMNRHTVLSAGGAVTFESKWKEMNDFFIAGYMAWSHYTKPGGAPLADVHSGGSMMIEACWTHGVEAGKLANDRSLANMVVFFSHMCFAFSLGGSDMDWWDPHSGGGEDALVAAVEYHTPACYTAAKTGVVGIDFGLSGAHVFQLTLTFGNLPAAEAWVATAVMLFTEIDYTSSPSKFATVTYEPFWAQMAAMVLVRLNRKAEALAVLGAIGFSWSERGFSLFEAYLAAHTAALPGFSADEFAAYHRLSLYLASPQTPALDKEASAWIPSPAALFELDRAGCYGYTCGGISSVLHLAARAFLQLGRDDDALEVARLAVSTVESTMARPYVAVECHCVLGEVAAKRGDLNEAGGHFGRALEVAKASRRLPMLELLAGQEWKRAVDGSGAAADAAIDTACVKMGKSRASLASLL